MRPALRRLALLPLLLLGGCAEIAQMSCHSDAQRAGAFLGTHYAGETCVSMAGYQRKGRNYPGSTSCSPRTESIYKWNEASDRVYAVCMAEVARRYPPRLQPGLALAAAPAAR